MITYLPPDHIHLEITRRCPLECPKCRRQKDKGQFKPNVDLSLDLVKKIFKNKTYNMVHLCGDLGDPIYHPDALEIIKICKQFCKKIRVNTNGSGKKISWWKKYYSLLSDKDETVFGIDGLRDTSKKYRINQDWDSSFEALKLGAEMNKAVVWQWIPFSFNEHQIDEAQALAKRYNIPFMILKSSRWSNNDPLKPTNPNLYIDYFVKHKI